MRPEEEELYAKAAEEIAIGQVNRGLMAKAYSSCGGDEKKTKALYIKLRVAQLAENLRCEAEQLKALKKEEERKRKAAATAVLKKRIWGGDLGYWIMFIFAISLVLLSSLMKH
jgi:hypothetical protein